MTAAEISPAPSSEPVAPRPIQNRLRVLLATPGDVQDERALLTKLIQDADARARARFGVELEMVNPTPADLASVNSAVELADIFIGVVWTQFGKAPVETNAAAGASVFAGTENDFASALEQAVGRGAGSLRTVVYRSIHPPDDLLHLNLAEYTQVHEFFARVGDYAGEDFIRVYTDASELVADAQARLEAWAFNYAGDLANALAEHGNASAALGQNSGALDDFAQAISLYHELDRPEQELVLWLRVAAICRRENQRDQAADALDAALRLARLVEDDESAAHALHQTGLLAADAQDWRNAQRAFQQARAYLEPDAALRRVILADEISAQENLGDAAHAEGDPLRAREAYRDALVLAQESGAAPRAAALWHKLGAVAAERGEWADARDAYAQALALLDADASPETRADLLDAQAAALMQLARQARAAGDSETAASEYRAALAASEQGRNPPARRVEIFAALGALAAERESWDQAIDWNARALAKVDTLADASRRPSLLYAQAAAYESLGTVRRKAENFASAANAFNEAFALYQELGARTEQGIVLHALGFIAYSQAHWQEALALFTQALGYLDAPDAQEIRFDTLGTRAETFERIGDAHLSDQEWAQAEMAYIQARDYLEQLGLGPHIGTLLTKLGIVTAAQGRREEALAYFQYARTRLTAPEHAQAAAEAMRLEANTLREIADSSRAAGDFLQAHALYRQQLDLAQTLQDTALEGAAFHQLGLVAADQEHWDDAINDYAQAYGLLEDPAHVETRTLIQRHQLAAYQKLGEREHAARQLPQAELAYRSALALAQTFEERTQEADLLYALGLISIQRENWDEALIDLRRALGIYNLQPQAPHKAQVIWNIGRAQRGAKHKQMHDALQRAHTARDAQDWDTAVAAYQTALQLANELGDVHIQADALEHLGDAATAHAAWDNALGYFAQARERLERIAQARERLERIAQAREQLEPTAAVRHARIARAQIDALRQRSASARLAEQWSSADADLAGALALAQELDDRAASGEIIYERGLIAAAHTHWNEAIDLYANALEHLAPDTPQRGEIERAQAEAYQALGDSEHNAQNWQAAEAAYKQALALQINAGNRGEQAVLLATLGDVAVRQARWQAAVTHLTQARVLETDVDAPHVVTLDQEIARATLALKQELQVQAEAHGDAQRAARDFAGAYAEYAHALGLADELQSRAAQAELHAKLGAVAAERGEFENARRHYQAAAALYDAPEQRASRSTLIELQAQQLEELGNRAGENGRWHDALAHHQQAIALLDAPHQTEPRQRVVQLSALTLQNLGDQARADAQWQAALEFYQRAAGLFAMLGATAKQPVVWGRAANVVANLARQARGRGEYAGALAYYRQAESLFRDAQDVNGLDLLQRERIGGFSEAGDSFARNAQWNAAAAAYQDGYALAQDLARAQSRELGDRVAQADLLARIGDINARQARMDQALAYYQAALMLTEDNPAPELRDRILSAQQQTFRALADTQRVSGDLENAQANYNGALTAALERNARTEAGELYFVLGTLAADENAWDRALGNYALALENVEPAQRADVKTYQAFAYSSWGDAQRAAGQFDAAASAYTSALECAAELGDAERAGQVLYRFGLLNATLGHWQRALDYYTQAAARLPETETAVREALSRDRAIATRAFKRSQLDLQLEHARTARQASQWDDAATAYRAALGLARDLDDTTLATSIERDWVSLYDDKGAALHGMELWDEANEAYRASLHLACEFDFQDQADARRAHLLALSIDKTKALRAIGKREDAERAAQDTLALTQEFGDTNAQADALYTLGAFAAQDGDWEAAQVYYAQARPLLVAAERSDVLVQLDHDRATAQENLARQAQ